MAYQAHVLTVLIASPEDTTDARDMVELTIASWNRDRARSERVVLQPLRWETDSVPDLGGDAQSIINKQLVDEADVVIVLFHSRLGAPTARSESGTVEEIERARSRGAPVHVYFSEQPHPYGVDTKELGRLNEFKTRLQGDGLLGSFASDDDLRAKVRTALEADVRHLSSTPGSDRLAEGDVDRPRAILRARYDYEREPHYDSHGLMSMRTRSERLVIENLGTGTAEVVDVKIEPIGEGGPPIVHLEAPIENILPNASVDVMVLNYAETAAQWRVVLSWREGDSDHEQSQTVTPI